MNMSATQILSTEKSYEDERPRPADRRQEDQRDLRRLLQLGNQLANYVEIINDPALPAMTPGTAVVGPSLVTAFRRALERYQSKSARDAISRMRAGCTVAGCDKLGFK